MVLRFLVNFELLHRGAYIYNTNMCQPTFLHSSDIKLVRVCFSRPQISRWNVFVRSNTPVIQYIPICDTNTLFKHTYMVPEHCLHAKLLYCIFDNGLCVVREWCPGLPNLKTRTPHPSPIDIPNNLTRPSFMFINKNIWSLHVFQLCLEYRFKWYFTRAWQLWF